ncbi:MAG: hypothetical protein FWG92_06440 [Leptospirales bacterium]|nr:hypothetical protein [Leptospirales bacterium]
MAINSISGQDVMAASNLQSAREYARESSSVDTTITTQSSYQEPELGSNIDTSA